LQLEGKQWPHFRFSAILTEDLTALWRAKGQFYLFYRYLTDGLRVLWQLFQVNEETARVA
jgi:hypothetical protein